MTYPDQSRFEWDETKNASNLRKHGVSFFEARELLVSGVSWSESFDRAHSDREDRYITVGPVRRGLLVVVWTPRSDNTIRIITTRWADAREQARFYTERGG